jgi:hypothetical protein
MTARHALMAAQEKSVRIYSRNSSPAYVAAVHRAFEAWARRNFGTKFVGSTPLKVRPGGLPDVPAALAAAARAAVGGAAVAGPVGAKRGRELQFSAGAGAAGGAGAGGDDTSPTNLLRTKQRRQVEQSISDDA